MNNYENQEAFVLAAKRVKARIQRAKALNINNLNSKSLKKLVQDLATAKAITDNKKVEDCISGQEYYVQTLLDALSNNVNDLIQQEYDHATMELGTTDEIMQSLEALQAA